MVAITPTANKYATHPNLVERTPPRAEPMMMPIPKQRPSFPKASARWEGVVRSVITFWAPAGKKKSLVRSLPQGLSSGYTNF